MNRRIKITLGIVGAGMVLVAVAAGVLWYRMGQPLYEPGMVRSGKNLSAPLAPPPQPSGGSFWTMENGIQLYHFTAGEGRPVLVVHGGPGVPYVNHWAGLEPLTASYQFHYYDQRGCGESTRPIDRFTSTNYYENLTTLDKTLGLGAQIADIERIRQILGEERLIIVGHSFGGFIASLYAAEFPDHVEALILISPADVLVMPQPDGGLFEIVGQRLPDDMRSDYDAYLKRYLDFGGIFSKSESELAQLNEEFGKYYAAVAPLPLSEQGRTGGWMVQAMYFSLGQRHDYRKALAEVNAPVLVIHGANDLQSEQASRVYADAFANSQFVVLEDATHFSFEEQPQAFALVVGEFLNSLPTP
ncbi:MAG TPA: alpha/beta fold hydrolase [Anaerolineales bacterium]|nr:alpha/beta fold hydrolase [Anaerolineales bacterium]